MGYDRALLGAESASPQRLCSAHNLNIINVVMLRPRADLRGRSETGGEGVACGLGLEPRLAYLCNSRQIARSSNDDFLICVAFAPQ